VPFRSENWDKALWLLTVADRPRDVPDILSAVEAPVLFITGDDDRIVPPEDTERAAGLLEEAEFVVIEECGHIPHEEKPMEFLSAILAFL